jgi:hypothetical protein
MSSERFTFIYICFVFKRYKRCIQGGARRQKPFQSKVHCTSSLVSKMTPISWFMLRYHLQVIYFLLSLTVFCLYLCLFGWSIRKPLFLNFVTLVMQFIHVNIINITMPQSFFFCTKKINKSYKLQFK